jgi:hypothetical protein
MLKRIPVSAALTGLALTGVLCACGSAAQHSASAGAGTGLPSSAATPAGPPSPGRSSSPAPVSAAPVIFAVRLGRSFQPSLFWSQSPGGVAGRLGVGTGTAMPRQRREIARVSSPTCPGEPGHATFGGPGFVVGIGNGATCDAGDGGRAGQR